MARSRTTSRGRPTLEAYFLARCAEDYAYAMSQGIDPVRFVADVRRASIQNARNWIFACRRHGLLVGRVKHGVPGGRLSAKATRLLKGGATGKRS